VRLDTPEEKSKANKVKRETGVRHHTRLRVSDHRSTVLINGDPRSANADAQVALQNKTLIGIHDKSVVIIPEHNVSTVKHPVTRETLKDRTHRVKRGDDDGKVMRLAPCI
jgi:hypothetical protein